MFRFLLIALLLSSSTFAHAAVALFYQPLADDRTLPEQQWPVMFNAARTRYGMDTLVLQWTRHDDAFSDAEGREWLQRRMRDAKAQGFRVVIGLASDPEFFQHQQSVGQDLERYLSRLARNNLQMALGWVQTLPPGTIDGWYLPEEIDDFRWRDADARRMLMVHLERQYKTFSQLGVSSSRTKMRRIFGKEEWSRESTSETKKPIFVSSFFAGNMSPQSYHDLLREISSTGVSVWVQDGAGTGVLNENERRLYLDALENCDAGLAAGIIHELFKQVGSDENFRAEPVQVEEAEAILDRRTPCRGDSVFFELRYLPGIGNELMR